MNPKPKIDFVTVEGLGLNPNNEPSIMVTIYGPRGGTRSIESISIASAKELVEQLKRAIEKLQ
jgi:hypothetical protein